MGYPALSPVEMCIRDRVWAAEFSDGTDAAVATEAPAAETFSDETADAPVVEDVYKRQLQTQLVTT